MVKILVIAITMVMSLNVFASDVNVILDDALSNLTLLMERVDGIKTIAINDFEYAKDIEVKNVEEKVVWRIAKSGKFRIVDRKSLSVLLNEQKLTLTGVVEEVSEMKKVGRIIGVDAFLFGKVSKSKNKIIINLMLKEVATGAILWNEEFIGDDPSAATVGVGIRVGTYSADSKTLVSNGTTKDFFNTQDKSQGFLVAFLFHYVQKTQFSNGFSFGVDGIFSRGDWQLDRFEETTLFNNTYYLLADGRFTDYNLTLIPIIRVHPMRFFGLPDMLVVYGGAGISTDFVELNGKYRLKKNDNTDDTGEISYASGMKLNAGGFAYKYGVEVRFAENFSMFFEGYQLPEMIMKFDVNSKIVPELRVKRGNYYGLGAKYYFFTF